MAPPSGAVPPELAPTVEEAYRRKCIELKRRLIEVEESNDQQRIRVVRARRGIDKLRIERAYLMEQLAKRTSTNVEDSEGSPSPPGTPKEKPLRTKRGHRKPEHLNPEHIDARLGLFQQGPVTLSPSSDAFSHTHTHPEALRNSTPQAQFASSKRQLLSNGNHIIPSQNYNPVPTQARPPKNSFDVYCDETRPILLHRHAQEISDGLFLVEDALARGWATLDSDKKEQFFRRFEQIKSGDGGEREVGVADAAPSLTLADGVTRLGEEDIEMVDETGTPGVAEAGGFTAVNRD